MTLSVPIRMGTCGGRQVSGGGAAVRYLCALVVASLLGVAGCASTSDTVQLKVPREQALNRCIRKLEVMGYGHKMELARLTRVSKERAPAVACERIVRAVEKGRITWADFAALNTGSSSKVWPILAGR